jgi:hypothetical protein
VDQTDDMNPYLNEMRAALKKPMASVQPIGRKLLQLKLDIKIIIGLS